MKIVDLATDMIRLMGLRVGDDVDIAYTGLRPGEKIQAVSHSEEIEKTPHEKIMLVKTSSVGLFKAFSFNLTPKWRIESFEFRSTLPHNGF